MSKLTFAERAWEEYLYKADGSVEILQCKGHYDD